MKEKEPIKRNDTTDPPVSANDSSVDSSSSWMPWLITVAMIGFVAAIIIVPRLTSQPSADHATTTSSNAPVIGPAATAAKPASSKTSQSSPKAAPAEPKLADQQAHVDSSPKSADNGPVVPNPITDDMQEQVRVLLQKNRQAVLADPSSEEKWANLGIVCDAHKLYECAEVCYRRAHALDPLDFTPVYLLAMVLDVTGRGGDEALSLYRRATELRSDYAPAFWRLGAALEKRGKLNEALDAYLTSTEADLDFPMGHRSAGQVLLAMGDVQSAFEHLDRASTLAPHDGAIYAALAQAHRRLGEPELAKQAAEKAKQFEPIYDVPDPVRRKVRAKAAGSAELYTKGKQNVYEGHYNEAIRDLVVCEAADPDDPILQTYLATAYRSIGQLEQSKTHALQALKLKPDVLSAHLELAAVYIRRDKVDEGMEQYRLAQQIEPDNSKVAVWVAGELLKKGYDTDAIDLYEKADALGSMDEEAHWMWGVALAEIGDVEAAKDQYRKSVRINSAYANAYYSMGLIMEQEGHIEEAIIHYQSAVRIDPNHIARERLEALGG